MRAAKRNQSEHQASCRACLVMSANDVSASENEASAALGEIEISISAWLRVAKYGPAKIEAVFCRLRLKAWP